MPTAEFYEMISEYESQLAKDAETTKLPNHTDYDKIDKLVAEINLDVIRQGGE